MVVTPFPVLCAVCLGGGEEREAGAVLVVGPLPTRFPDTDIL